MTSIGTLSINSATDFTASKTYKGTSAKDDYIDFQVSIVPVFAELYLDSLGDLSYKVQAPTLGKSSAYVISWADPATAVEGSMRAGSTNEAYNGLSLFAGPGDYSQQTAAYSLFGTVLNDTLIAPLEGAKASSLQGWLGDDTLIGGNTDNTLTPGPGQNRVEGKKGADVYRTKTEYMANDTIVDDGDDLVTDTLQVLLSTKNAWDWSFKRVGNDLEGTVSDAVSSYKFTVKDQYLSNNPNAGLEGLSLYAVDQIGLLRAIAFKPTNTSAWNNYADAGTSSNDRFKPDSSGMGAEKIAYRCWGHEGNDALDRSASSNVYVFFDGGSGVDTVTYTQARSNYTLTKYSSTFQYEGFTVKNSTAPSSVSADNMTRVERFIFSDKKLAYDLNGNAGNVAKILGAVFGKAAVANKEYVGIGLQLLDGGMSYSELGALAVSVAGASTPEAIVDKLYLNVLGTLPTASQKAPYVQLLNDGMASGDLVTLAADTTFNQTNIGLTGLITTGLEFA